MSNPLPLESGYRAVDIGDPERRRDAQFRGKRSRDLDRRHGEVKLAGQRPVPRPRQRAKADVALEIQQPLAANVPRLAELERAQ
jgi:hypothetical protein